MACRHVDAFLVGGCLHEATCLCRCVVRVRGEKGCMVGADAVVHSNPWRVGLNERSSLAAAAVPEVVFQQHLPG